MTQPLVLVSCGAHKQPAPSPAGQLYVGSYSRMCLRAAHALTEPHLIRIVSARHGLLPLDRVVAPYETRMTDPEAITADELHAQADAQDLAGRTSVIVLAGIAYATVARVVWPHAELPLAGSRGIGEHRQRLASIIRAATAAPGDMQLQLNVAPSPTPTHQTDSTDKEADPLFSHGVSSRAHR